MPAGIDEIYKSLRFDKDEVNFSKWPKLSCSAANELTLATPPTEDDPNPGVARLAIAGELKLQIGVAVNELSSDEKLTNNSDLAIPTQKAVKTYVDNQITLVNQTLSTKAALNGASSQDFQSKNLSVSGNLTANGNVSIGTITSSYKLAIAAGDINIDDGRALRQAGRWIIGGDSNVLSIGSFNAPDGRDIRFDPGFAGALTIKKDTGNVGIGTTEPKRKLHIQGTSSADFINDIQDRPGLAITGNYPELDLVSGVNNPNHGPTIRLGAYNDDAKNAFKHWVIGTAGRNASFLDIGFSARNDPNPHSGIRNHNGTTVLTLLENGNVGIGTTAPSTKLDVRGNLFVQAEVRADGGFQVDGQTVIDGDAGWHRSYGNTGWYNGTHGGGWYMEDSTWIRSYGGKNIYHDRGILRTDGTLQVGPNGERLIVNTSGNVGIGTSNPSQKLDVIGNINYTGVLTKLDTAEQFSVTVRAADFLLGHSGRRGTPGRALVDAGNTLGINWDGDWPSTEIRSNLVVRGQLYVDNIPFGDRRNMQWDSSSKLFYHDNSSRKSKENITTLVDDFPKILSAEPKTYTRPNNPDRWEIGYIAEEFHELGLETLVYYDEDGSPGAINYPKICMYLVEIIKKHEQTLKEYEDRINQLEQQ